MPDIKTNTIFWEKYLLSSFQNGGPVSHPRNVGCYIWHYHWARLGDWKRESKNEVKLSYSFKVLPPPPQFSVYLFAVNLWLLTVLKNLILTVFAWFFIVSVKDWPWKYLLFSADFTVEREITIKYAEFLMPMGRLNVHVLQVVRYEFESSFLREEIWDIDNNWEVINLLWKI